MALPIFPVRLQTSIVGRNELNFRVRNGNGWTLALISTNCRRKKLRFAASDCSPDIRSAPFFLLSPHDPLRWARVGAPFLLESYAHIGPLLIFFPAPQEKRW